MGSGNYWIDEAEIEERIDRIIDAVQHNRFIDAIKPLCEDYVSTWYPGADVVVTVHADKLPSLLMAISAYPHDINHHTYCRATGMHKLFIEIQRGA